ncbi:aldehyde dehydrogenase family protein [Leptospira gomenensis]|uniref:aldehyde dehydrogenase family protein n=1 Tax=Leptospira gomenensis TaxID=2484974 RepID=UPI001FEB2964|nr:aldehyde dehydrogenase family protein [Leptospira gomenensis]
MSVGTATQSNVKPGRVHSTSGSQTAQNPAILEEIGKISNTDLQTISAILQKAREAQKLWARTKFSGRKKHILKVRDYGVDPSEELAAIVNKGNGKSRKDALATKVLPSSPAADWYTKNAGPHLGPERLPSAKFLFFDKRDELHRVYVQEKIYYKFINLFSGKTEMMRTSSDRNFDLDLGSMTTEVHLNTAKRRVDDAAKNGAKIPVQSKPKKNTNGYFYPAALIVDVNHRMELMREENFGSVIPLMKFETVEEAVELADDSTRLRSKIIYTHTANRKFRGAVGKSPVEMTQPKLVNRDLIPTKRNIGWYPFDKTSYGAISAARRSNFTRNPISWITDRLRITVFMLGRMKPSWKV